jgi:hypothetical protein
MPATMELLNRVLQSTELTNGEKLLLKWQFRLNEGSFDYLLMTAISHADERNSIRLERGFPQEVAAMRRWHQGTLAEDFNRLAGVKIC